MSDRLNSTNNLYIQDILSYVIAYQITLISIILYLFNDEVLIFLDISQEMAISTYDIVSTLQALGMIKYWKGKHIVLKKQVIV